MAHSVQALDAELLGIVEKGLLQWLCQEVQRDLRLHLHASREPRLSLDSSAAALHSAAPLLRLPPSRCTRGPSASGKSPSKEQDASDGYGSAMHLFLPLLGMASH